MTGTPPTVLLISTRAMVCAAEEAGVSAVAVNALLAEAGLSRELLMAAEARHPADRVLELWGRLQAEADDPTLQLSAPTCLPFGSYGVVDYLVDASSTVGEGMERFARFFRLVADGVGLSVGEDEGEPFLAIAGPAGSPVPAMYVDYVFAALVGRIRMHIRPELAVLEVEFRRPRLADPEPYEACFRAPVRFGGALDRLRLTRSEWMAPTQNGDNLLAGLMERHAAILSDRLPRPVGGIVAEVQKAILESLPESPRAEDVAKTIYVSCRTLHRRLAQAGVTFGQVTESVRAELAKEYLSGDASISEVAFLLGFSEQSSFNRAFRRWTGMAPGRWRRARGAPAADPAGALERRHAAHNS